ncbi:MAG TPA: hypothetical protein PKO30_15565 [Prolixibacteraceae bacterium]|nr:hypothetical protein [Prolixibacteraceae bacterium]
MNDIEFTIADQIETVRKGFRHVVILGAGASKAACLDRPEKNQKKIPLMNELPDVIDLSNEIKDISVDFKTEGFEELFSRLYETEGNSPRLDEIERKIYDYFKKLEISDSPTIYDYLVLSLRNKDMIATFNWDPFLWQAYERNLKFTKDLPQLAFLHGNVAIGISKESMTFGPTGRLGLQTGKIFEPTRLLYPIGNKNYTDGAFIEDQWNLLSHFLGNNPSIVTIFGYRAPKTDIEAIRIMKEAWGITKIEHEFTRIEIINTEARDELIKTWDDFIFETHYEIYRDFFESSISLFPRRTGEVFNARFIEGRFYEEHVPPKFETLREMWQWYTPLIAAENSKLEN